MSSWGAVAHEEPPARRVREEVKDGAAVVALTAVMSTAVSILVLILMKLAG